MLEIPNTTQNRLICASVSAGIAGLICIVFYFVKFPFLQNEFFILNPVIFWFKIALEVLPIPFILTSFIAGYKIPKYHAEEGTGWI